jgi:hypothetical protein
LSGYSSTGGSTVTVQEATGFLQNIFRKKFSAQNLSNDLQRTSAKIPVKP